MEANALTAASPAVNDPSGTPTRVPVVDYLVLDEQPYIQAQCCNACGALYFDRRNACARCFATEFSPRRLAGTGKVRAFTVVHRAAPNIPAPYMSVVVDLDGGGVIKSNLLGVTDPQQIKAGQRIKLETFTAGVDDDGTEAIAFGYKMDGDEL
ncbi:OB-fold domain-containing protein [Arthrobacter sp. I2-34]|uniref:OB-fold domain-containing protein n=1 Tax=Arthrobacter hankyongi TaxID=2904801 RepID=A0ABS9L3L0_9MICC|nr:OB-fold domain-containing protein [Arthrobacter hankyongi]MCG2621248.1 OB-fold domain-containing protein [Arthrobacter hankyongi]